MWIVEILGDIICIIDAFLFSNEPAKTTSDITSIENTNIDEDEQVSDVQEDLNMSVDVSVTLKYCYNECQVEAGDAN